MALNVCWTAAMTRRTLGPGGRPSSGHLGSCPAHGAEQTVLGVGREYEEGAKMPKEWEEGVQRRPVV